MKIYEQIIKSVAEHRKLFAVLIDPEKCYGEQLRLFLPILQKNPPDFIFIGGSQLATSVTAVAEILKKNLSVPIVLFPGNAMQFAENVDAMLFLSLISGRNAEYLIGQQVKVAACIKKSSVETVATGYILVDGGNQSAVAFVSNTKPIAATDIETIVNTALAAELMGQKLIYLEAGSGALHPISTQIISAVKSTCGLPLIVGGGICLREQMEQAYSAGADLVVVGNYLERHPEKLPLFSLH